MQNTIHKLGGDFDRNRKTWYFPAGISDLEERWSKIPGFTTPKKDKKARVSIMTTPKKDGTAKKRKRSGFKANETFDKAATDATVEADVTATEEAATPTSPAHGESEEPAAVETAAVAEPPKKRPRRSTR